MENWTPVPDPDDNPDNSLKMKIAFVVLLLILIGMIVYFTKFANKYPITALFIPSPTPYIFPTLTPTPAPTIIPTKTSAPVSLTTSPTKREFQGKIVKIEVDTSNPLPDSYEHKLLFSLEELGESKGITKFNFTFTEAGLNNLKVIDLTGEKISYKNLEVGQNIRIIETYESKGSSNYDIEIIILN